MVGRIWETHKAFIIGIVVGLLFLFVAHRIAVAPLHREAAKTLENAQRNEKNLMGLFKGSDDQPTRTTANLYRKANSGVQSELDALRTMVGFPVQAPYVLPAGEKMPEAYYVDVFSKTVREIQVAANSRAVEIRDQVLAGRGSVDDVPSALVGLAVFRRAVLTAIAAGVSSIEAVLFSASERSAPIQGFRLSEALITLTVKGSSLSLQEWLANLGRRDSFLIIATAELKGPEGPEGGELVTAKVSLGPLTVTEAAPAEEDMEE